MTITWLWLPRSASEVMGSKSREQANKKALSNFQFLPNHKAQQENNNRENFIMELDPTKPKKKKQKN